MKGEALQRAWLPEQLRAKAPDLTLKERREAFDEEHEISVSKATTSRNIPRLPGG